MNLFTYIKRQLSILTVVNDYAKLKRAGLYWKGHCPFHNEKTASFTVSPHKEIFYCFGCHSGGDVIAFIAKAENCTPIEAAKHLIERYQLTVPESINFEASSKNADEKKHYYDVCKLVAQWCHQALLNTPSALAYVTNRGISSTSISYYCLGYFPGGTQGIRSLLTAMQKQQLLPDDLIQAHILSQGKTVLFSPFEERIIFPIKDHLGRFCGFGGRTFKPHDERAKYYNSRESNQFAKGSLLFGLDVAKHSIQKTEKVFLVEGYTDCIAMTQHGYANTVATLGTACTAQHLAVIARYAQELYVLYDGDHAGQEAILRLTELCWQVAMELKVVCLPAKEDPASFLGSGNNLEPLIAQAQDLFVFFINSLGKDFTGKSLQDKLLLTRKIIDTIHLLDDPLKRDLLLQKAAKTLDIPLEALKNELRRSKTPHRSSVHAQVPVYDPSPRNATPQLEKKLFFAILQNIQLLTRDNEGYIIEYIPDPFQTILKKLQVLKEQYQTLDFTQFFDKLTGDEQHFVSKTLIELEGDTSVKEFDQLLLQLQKKHWKSIVLAMKTKLALAQDSAQLETIEKTLQDFLALKKKLVHKNLI
jgi:DNA primase